MSCQPLKLHLPEIKCTVFLAFPRICPLSRISPSGSDTSSVAQALTLCTVHVCLLQCSLHARPISKTQSIDFNPSLSSPVSLLALASIPLHGCKDPSYVLLTFNPSCPMTQDEAFSKAALTTSLLFLEPSPAPVTGPIR